MYKPSGEGSPQNFRETSSVPPENSTWHRGPYNRDFRTDKMDRDRVGAGKRHWIGDQSLSTTSFQGVTSGASLSGNHFAPRSKPRFQGHYSGFFAETGRNGPALSATGSVDTGLVRRFHRNPYPSGTSAAKSQGFRRSAGVDYRSNDTEERHNRDQFLPFGNDREGRDQPLLPHTSQVHSDSPSTRNGERTRPLGINNWEYPPRIDRDILTRPYGSADLYNSRRRSIVTQFDSGRDWGVGDKRCEVGRFERYGNGRDGPRADHEGSNKDTGFSHGWRRERGDSGVIVRHSSFTAASRNSGDLLGGSLSVGSAHNPLHATALTLNQDFEQPSPFKRPRLGWGQGLAKYEKKGDDVSSSVVKSNVEKEGEDDASLTVGEIEEKRGVEHEKLVVIGWEHEYKLQHGDSFIDAHERRGENEMIILIREHGVREVRAQDASSCVLLPDSLRMSDEDERRPVLAQALQGHDGRPSSHVEIEGDENNMRGGRDENRGAFSNGSEEPELDRSSLAPSIPAEDNESRRRDDEVTFGMLEERELLKGKDRSLKSSLSVEEPERIYWGDEKSCVHLEKFENFLVGKYQNSSLIEPMNNVQYDLTTSDTLCEGETRGVGISSSLTFVTECDCGEGGIDAILSFSPTSHAEMNAEDSYVVCPMQAFPEMSSCGCEKHNSPRSYVLDDFSTAPAPVLLAESVGLPESSPKHISTSVLPSNHQYDEQDVIEISVDERPLKEAEVLEEAGKITLTVIEVAPKEILGDGEFKQNPEASHWFLQKEKTISGDSEPASAVLQTEPTIALDAASLDPSTSEVREQVFVTTKSGKTTLKSEPASEESLVTVISTVYACVSGHLNDVDHSLPVESASQTEKSIIETVDRVEAEIVSVKKEIAQNFELSSEFSADVCLETSGTHDAALDSPSKNAEGEDVSIPMEEYTTHTGVVYHYSQSSPTAVSMRLEKSLLCYKRDISKSPALLLREINIPEKQVLGLVPGGVQFKSANFNKGADVEDVRGVRLARLSLSLGSEELYYFENQFGNEVTAGGSSLQERDQTTIELFVMENKKIAGLSGAPFVHLLPKHHTETIDQRVDHSHIEPPACQHNVETHTNIPERLLEKIAERRSFIKFKERVLALRYRALKEAWTREQKGLFDGRNHFKTVCSEGRSDHGPSSQRSSLRLRPLSLDRPDAESDAAQAMKTLMKNPQVEALRPVLKMPAMILDEKERAVRRFVSRNALVEDPIAVEMERKTLNPWTAEERKTFAEKFAVYNKKFKVIASYLQYKTTADCVEFYYRNKKSEEFGKSQHGIQLKNRWDYTKSNSTFLTPTTAGIIRNYEVNCARIEALNAANTNIKLFQSKSQLQVFENANPSSDPFILPSNIEMLEVILPSGATMETAMSSLISTPCSVSSAAAPVTDQRKEKESRKERIRSWASTARSSHLEQHPAGLKGTRSTCLRRISSRAAGQEDSEWTDAERELFTSAVAAYGKNFRIIASHVSTKSQSQCKSFFSKTRKRLCLDELVEQFQANEVAAMLVQSLRHDADLAQEVKLISIPEIDASAGIIGEELIDTAAAVSTLASLKGQSKFLANNMSDLSLVADAAAVMDEITLVKPESATVDSFASGKLMTSSQDLACELLKINRSNFTIPSTTLREEEDEDSEATKSDGGYQVGTEFETDIVVDQAAAALIGMSEMLADKSELKRSMFEAKGDTKLSPVSVFSPSQSARLPIICPPHHAVTEANLYLTSGRSARHAKERVNATMPCKATTRDRPQDMHDVHIVRKCRETVGGEPKPRREPTSWTQEEKEKFAVILQEHGKDWALLHESLPSKSLTQIKTYFQNSKARSRLPASDKLLTVVRNDGANRKRKADEFDSTRRAADLALLAKQNVRSNVAPSELGCATQNVNTLVGSALVSGTAGVGVDIPAYAAHFGAFSGQPADQDSLCMDEMQHLVRQMVSTSTYDQGNTQDGQKGLRSGARPALPSSVVIRPHSRDGIQHLLSGSGPSKRICSDLRALSPGVVPQAGPPAVIHQVAQQVQQMLQQQQHLQKQLNLLIQQQTALPQLLLQHKQAAKQTLQAVRPLEEKLHQVVQQLQQQYELQGRGQAPAQDEESLSRMDHFQHQHITPARGILKVKPIRGAVCKPLVHLATLPSSVVLPNQAKSQNECIQLQQQGHSLSLGIGTISTVTAGSTAGVQESHAKTVELQDSDTDTDCEGIGRRLMVTEDSHQRMSIVHSTSSGQQPNTTQSTTSTLSSDSEQVKSWDVKLFGQSLLSKPPSVPSSVLRSAGSSIQDFLNPNPSSSLTTIALPTATLLKGFRTSECLPSAFGRVGASSIIPEGQQQPPSWSGQYGAWKTTSSLQLSGANELTRRKPDSERAQEAITSLAAQSNTKVLVLAPKQSSQGDAEHLDSECGNLRTVQFETDGAIEGGPSIGRSQSSLNGGQVAKSEVDQWPIGPLDPTQIPSQMSNLPIVLAGHGQWG